MKVSQPRITWVDYAKVKPCPGLDVVFATKDGRRFSTVHDKRPHAEFGEIIGWYPITTYRPPWWPCWVKDTELGWLIQPKAYAVSRGLEFRVYGNSSEECIRPAISWAMRFGLLSETSPIVGPQT